jgi:hypothetical protein
MTLEGDSPPPARLADEPRTVAAKMGVTAGTRAYLANAPSDSVAAMRLPALEVLATLTGAFDYLHLFTTTQQDLHASFPVLAQHLAPRGALWVSWPKGRKRGTDLTLPVVIRIGYSHGLVESTCLSIDQTWSGLKFTHPKPGKSYQNSFGTLPDGVGRAG